MDVVRQLSAAQQSFVAPRGLGQSRPRPVRLTAAGRALVVMALVLVAGAIAAAAGLSRTARQQARDAQALDTRGAITGGEVTRLWSKGDERHRVGYTFVADGHSYSGRLKVPREMRRTLHVGSPLRVRYLPENPGVNDLVGVSRRVVPMPVAFLVPAVIAVGAGLCLLAINGQRRLLAAGRAAPAIVTGHQTTRTSRGGTHRSLTYVFPLLSGATATGKCGTSNKPPEVGSVICVLYDPEAPSRSKVYPLSLVTTGQ